jgi:hypothetical protein
MASNNKTELPESHTYAVILRTNYEHELTLRHSAYMRRQFRFVFKTRTSKDGVLQKPREVSLKLGRCFNASVWA